MVNMETSGSSGEMSKLGRIVISTVLEARDTADELMQNAEVYPHG